MLANTIIMERKQLNISLSRELYNRLEELAREKGHPTVGGMIRAIASGSLIVMTPGEIELFKRLAWASGKYALAENARLGEIIKIVKKHRYNYRTASKSIEKQLGIRLSPEELRRLVIRKSVTGVTPFC